MKLFIDGAANPVRKTSALGILIVREGEQIQMGIPLNSFHDNHETEFLALMEALRFLKKKNFQEELILCHSDSKMLVDALEKNHSKKESHRSLLIKVKVLLEDFPHFHIKWIPEKENKGADQLARNALQKAGK